VGTVSGSVEATHVKCCNLRPPEAEPVIFHFDRDAYASLKLVNLYLFLLSCCVFTVDTLLFFLPENVLVGCGGGHPLPIPFPFGASILAPSALQLLWPPNLQCKILATPLFDLVTLNT